MNGLTYRFKRVNNSNVHIWYCSRKNCPSAVKTNETYCVIAAPTSHNHVVDSPPTHTAQTMDEQAPSAEHQPSSIQKLNSPALLVQDTHLSTFVTAMNSSEQAESTHQQPCQQKADVYTTRQGGRGIKLNGLTYRFKRVASRCRSRPCEKGQR